MAFELEKQSLGKAEDDTSIMAFELEKKQSFTDDNAEHDSTSLITNIPTDCSYSTPTIAQRIMSSNITFHLFTFIVILSFISILLLLTFVIPATTQQPQSRNYDNHSNYTSLIFKGFAEYSTWFEANQHCMLWGGKLAESGAENINEQIYLECSGERCWLGASDLEAEGRWVWSATGTKLQDSPQWWKKGTPDNGRGEEDEDCLYMYGQEYDRSDLSRLWNDKSCTKRLSSYVCQRDANKEILSECKGYKTQLECRSISNPDLSTNRPLFVPICTSLDKVRKNKQQQQQQQKTYSFAIIGDYGLAVAGCEVQAVELLQRIQTQYGEADFLLSTGDNAYWSGSCAAYASSVIPFFADLYPKGFACNDTHPKQPRSISLSELSQSKFFPSLGNHDWRPQKSGEQVDVVLPYFQVFPHVASIDELFLDTQSREAHSLPSRHLELLYGGFYQHSPIPGVIDVFVVNSNLGNPLESEPFQKAYKLQGEWLQRALEMSSAAFKVVVMHHPPFSTAVHDPPAKHMRYPFHEWNVDLVLSGHQHVYERMEVENVTYVINGLGGHHWRYEIEHCKVVVEGSRRRYNAAHGVMYGAINMDEMALSFYSVEEEGGLLIDEFILHSK